jgi:hypothetical protein
MNKISYPLLSMVPTHQDRRQVVKIASTATEVTNRGRLMEGMTWAWGVGAQQSSQRRVVSSPCSIAFFTFCGRKI